MSTYKREETESGAEYHRNSQFRYTHGLPQKLFQGGQRRKFAYAFQVADDAMQMDVHKTHYPFYSINRPVTSLGHQEGQRAI